MIPDKEQQKIQGIKISILLILILGVIIIIVVNDSRLKPSLNELIPGIFFYTFGLIFRLKVLKYMTFFCIFYWLIHTVIDVLIFFQLLYFQDWLIVKSFYTPGFTICLIYEAVLSPLSLYMLYYQLLVEISFVQFQPMSQHFMTGE